MRYFLWQISVKLYFKSNLKKFFYSFMSKLSRAIVNSVHTWNGTMVGIMFLIIEYQDFC